MPEESKRPDLADQSAPQTTPTDPSASVSPDMPAESTTPVHQSGQVITPSSSTVNQVPDSQPAQLPTPPSEVPDSSTSQAQPVAPDPPASPPTTSPQVIGSVPQVQSNESPPQPTVGTNQSPVVGHTGKSKRGVLFVALAAVLVLVLGGGYVFAFYLPNTPSHVFESGLKNSGLALDSLINYSKSQQQANYNSVSTSGTLQVKSPSGSYDMTASGSADKHGNATATVQADILGENVTANIRSIVSKGNTTPDLYVQVSGIKSFLDSLGAGSLDKYNGQWIVIDHTLVDTYTSALKTDLSSNSSAAKASEVPTYAEVQDAISKVQAVNKQYIFTSNSSTAVLANQKYLGQQTSNGAAVDEYQVGYNKAHLEAYVSAVSTALDNSQLNTWSKLANKGQSLSQVMDFNSLTKSVQNAKSNYTFYVWVDKSTKLISKVQFADNSDGSMKFTISQGYSGGKVYPFTFNVAGKDSQGNSQSTTVGLSLNTATNKVVVNYNSSSTSSSGTTTANGNFTVTPSKNSVQVTAPTGAKSFTNILLSLFGGSSLTTSGTVNEPVSGGTNIDYTGSLIPVNSQ